MNAARRGLRGIAIASILALALASPAQAQSGPQGAPAPAAARMFDVKECTLSYKLIHKLHEVDGVSKTTFEGKARLLPDGAGQVQVRAKVASFDSGNSNRDEHMREVTKEAAHPFVSVRGTLSGVVLPLAAPASVTLHATVELAGGKEQREIPLTLSQEGEKLRAKFVFPISLDALGVDRPELLFVKVDDAVNITGELLLAPAP